MPVTEISRESVGLLSVAEAAQRRGWSVSAVQKWIADGRLPAVVAGGGRRTVYLLRVRDVDRFVPPKRGRPFAEKT
jgi:excisionase family DNA binding protein